MPLATRAPSIHGTQRQMYDQQWPLARVANVQTQIANEHANAVQTTCRAMWRPIAPLGH